MLITPQVSDICRFVIHQHNASLLTFTVLGCNGNRANWGAEVHWSHVLDMTISWATGLNGTSYKNSSSLLTSIKSAMGYWFTNDYTNEGCTMGNGGSTCPCSTPGLCKLQAE